MKVLVTGSNGYIGSRLTPYLIKQGHEVYALTRNKERSPDSKAKIILGDLSDSNLVFPEDIDVAYYLVHSMGAQPDNFDDIDRKIARNFNQFIEKTNCKQVIYLSGLVNDDHLSKHLASRYEIEKILKSSQIPMTTLRAGIIIGAGSASFEIIRDLVEKLPVMIAPKWVNKKCQPISIVNVIEYLFAVLGDQRCLGKSFDIGGPDVLTYKEMMLKLAKIRKLKRCILTVPVFTPKLSSYWLFFITSTKYSLARSLVESLKNDAICKDQSIHEIVPKKCFTYEEAILRAFQKIEQNAVISSWRDSWSYSDLDSDLDHYVEVPKFGCYKFKCKRRFSIAPQIVKENIFNIGGQKGWYSMNWAWKIRGLIDRFMGGVGIRRGKTHRKQLKPGDALDFWRVILVDEKNTRLLLYAEMKIPGEAWLDFKIECDNKGLFLDQTATFRPRGVWGRLYWWLLYPFHLIIFPGMARYIIKQHS